MAAPTKLRSRLKMVKNLNSIFNALQIITTVRLKKARTRRSYFQEYSTEIERLFGQLDFPAFHAGKNARKLVILMTGSRGLCGNFNLNVFKQVQAFFEERASQSQPVKFYVFGKKGIDYLRKYRKVAEKSFIEEEYALSTFIELTEEIFNGIKSGELSEVVLIYNKYHSVIKQEGIVECLHTLSSKREGTLPNYIIEPDPRMGKEQLFRHFLAVRLCACFSESKLGEISSRMVVLKGAIDSSQELLDRLTIDMNKLRQQSITRELIELVGSAESMRGGME